MVESQPLVSVIVPSYNHLDYIEQTIASIMSQTYRNIELIIVDDNSSDGTSEYVSTLAASEKIHVFRKSKNKGIIDSLNTGIGLASGKYIAVCASDDYFHIDKIKEQVEVFEADDNLKILFTEGFAIDSNSNIICEIEYSTRDIEKYAFIDVLMKADLPPASVMFKKKDFDTTGEINPEFYVEDLALWLQLLKDGGYAKVIKKKLTYYRHHHTNTHMLYNEKVLDSHFKIVQYYSDGIRNKKEVLREWSLRNALMLSRVNKSKAFSYWKSAGFALGDYRFYWVLIKIIFSK